MFIKKRKMAIGEQKDIENAIATAEKLNAMMEYIAICDYPEILEEQEGEPNEQVL